MKRISSILLSFIVCVFGCSESAPTPSTSQSVAVSQPDRKWQNELFKYSIDNLDRLEEFNSAEMLRQIVDRLNQWIQVQKRPVGWHLDPIVATIPEPFAALPLIEHLPKMEYYGYDGQALQETVWLRNLSNWTRGDQLDELTRAEKMFDWIVRNIQLDDELTSMKVRPRQLPWETLLFGHGSATERSWLFILMARQQGIDAVVLAIPDDPSGKTKKLGTNAAMPAIPDDPSGKTKKLREWVTGVLIDGKLYLFDMQLGLPIPAPDGINLTANGELHITPATLAQVVKDDTLLRQLDPDKKAKFAVKAADLKDVVALIEASPTYLALRMKMIESRLTGDQKMVLSTVATAQAKRFKDTTNVADSRLWLWPYEAILLQTQARQQIARWRFVQFMPFQIGQDTPLWKARLLQFKGQFTGDKGATHYYQIARPSNDQLAELEKRLVESAVQQAVSNAEQKATREGADQVTLSTLKQQVAQNVRTAATHNIKAIAHALRLAKQDASYWLGLLAYEQTNYRSAIDYFEKRTLEASPNGPWTHGAKYNLGRSYEASGQTKKAIETYNSDVTSPAHYGNLLRARWLGQQHKTSEKK